MSDIKRFSDDACSRLADLIGPDRAGASGGRFDASLRVVASVDERTPVSDSDVEPQDWSGLVDLVHGAARRLRRIEVGARDQDRSLGEALQRAQDGIVAADLRAQQAETLADEVRHRAEARVAAAEARVAAAEARARGAEDRARHAESWLMRVQATILSEFPEPNAQVAA
ncbi:hypothetical protein MKK88_17050 [Methylobacterium sp. E-005]|uniref:hypothetical protein n=1 Tax=Methylobacterium sp. E-005 TaxID=2836549 RepID=UPI001FBAA88D|nr:hypothetical protein [Methylobacterium sp. E-005]MCJ2087677.1 hypothetical protein [Methylobacterium sp. E-005]